MNVDQFKDPLYLCLCGASVSSLSLMQEAVGSSTAILFTFENKWSRNLLKSVKTFRENSIDEVFDKKNLEDFLSETP